MADLDKRTKEEKNLTLAIMLLLASIDDDDMSAGFLSPRFFHERISGSSIPRLAQRIYLNSAGGMLNEIGIKGDANLRDFIIQQSSKYSRDLAERMSKKPERLVSRRPVQKDWL